MDGNDAFDLRCDDALTVVFRRYILKQGLRQRSDIRVFRYFC